MTNENKSPMFGPVHVVDAANHEPTSGKSALMNQMVAEMIIGNCTTSLPMKIKFDSKDSGHTTIFAPTRNGMSADYSAFGLTDAEVAEVKIIDKDLTTEQ